jgi:hypothetical protein
MPRKQRWSCTVSLLARLRVFAVQLPWLIREFLPVTRNGKKEARRSGL